MALFGYASLYANENDDLLNTQLEALFSRGVDSRNVFVENFILPIAKPDPLRIERWNFLEGSDELVVWQIDRIGPSNEVITSICRKLKEKNIKISVLEGPGTELFS